MEKILIVDDEVFIRKMMEDMLHALGYEPLLAENGKIALEILEKENPEIILMDVEMPIMDGITTVKKIRELGYNTIVLMLTAYNDDLTMKRCAEAGADDFLIKPVNMTQLSSRLEMVRKAKIFYSFQKALIADLKSAQILNQEIINKLTKENTDLSMELLKRLHLLAEYRDDETNEHTLRVGDISYELASALNKPPEYCYSLKLAAPLHDIGKVGIPDRILLKAGKLTPEEFEEMKKHTIIGWEILKDSKSSILRLAEKIALTHHEKWDGTGYPMGLSGEEIPLEGRIVCIADAIDAMLSKRPYKDPLPEDKVREELLRCKGTHFDPLLVDKALEIWDKILRIEGKIIHEDSSSY